MADLDTITCQRLKQADVEIDCQHRARSTYPFGEESGGGARARPHVKASPALTNSDSVELAHRVRLEKLLEERKPGSLELFGSILTQRVLDHRRADDTPANAREVARSPRSCWHFRSLLAPSARSASRIRVREERQALAWEANRV